MPPTYQGLQVKTNKELYDVLIYDKNEIMN